VKELGKTLRASDMSRPLVFATYFHPDELLPNRSGLYDLESVRANLEAVLRTCEDTSSGVEFIQASRVPALWSASA
jgi:hypothetical protein